eukprot:s4901_g1.t1
MARRSGCRLLALAVLGIFLPQVCFNAPHLPRRELVLSLSGAALLPTEAAYAAGFSPADLGSAEGLGTSPVQVQRVEDVNELDEAIYLISRVQEATVQQERLVTTGKFKDVQRNSITMALNMMLDNYKLADQVVAASGYVEPKASIMQASQVGNEAVDALETAKEYFGTPLKVSGLSEEQRKFLKQAMQACSPLAAIPFRCEIVNIWWISTAIIITIISILILIFVPILLFIFITINSIITITIIIVTVIFTVATVAGLRSTCGIEHHQGDNTDAGDAVVPHFAAVDNNDDDDVVVLVLVLVLVVVVVVVVV